MTPGSTKYFTQWLYDVWKNRFLCGAVFAGFVTIFPILYIPGLNRKGELSLVEGTTQMTDRLLDTVFLHTGISWEWGLVFVESTLFFLGVELWKFAKRVYIRHYLGGDLVHDPEEDLEMGAFSRYTTVAMTRSLGMGPTDEKKNKHPMPTEDV